MEIFNLKKQGYNISQIAKELDLDRKTVRKYLNRGLEALPLRQSRTKQSPKLDPYKNIIQKLLLQAEEWKEEQPSAVFIYQEIGKAGFTGTVSLVRKYLAKHREKSMAQLIPLFQTLPGKEAQVDWGEKLLPKPGGGRKKVYLFCMSLSHSGTRYTAFFPKANRYYFLLGHIGAFKYFGGVPETLLYDQTRCAVDKPGFGRVKWNEAFYDFARYYGFFPKVCLPYRARTKGKVENLVKYVKNNFLPLKIFEGFEKLNEEAREWADRVNSQLHPRTGKVPLDHLKEEEWPVLSPLPEKEYEIYEMEFRRIYLTSTFSFKNKRYSVPPEFLGKTVTLKYHPEKNEVRVYYQDQSIYTHQISKGPGKYIIAEEHQKEISRIMRSQFRVLKRRRGKGTDPDKDPFEEIKRPLSFYEEVL